MIRSKMHLFLTIIFLEAGVYAYEATPGKDVMGDAPWVVAIDKPIPFLWVFHDCNQNDVDELHCIAIYDITDGIKRYANGTKWIPESNNRLGNLQNPPLRPDPRIPDNVPNQVLYHHCGSSYINEKWWYRIDWRFEHVGSNWPSSLNGEEITPARLGYDVGDVITFRILILWEDEIFEKDNWHVQDFRVKVGPSENPLPTLPNWYSGDVHTHGAHTDTPWEWGAPTEYQAIANKTIGLNWVTVTGHSFCLGYRDECGFSGTFWEHLQYEANLYSEPDFVVIVGEELNTDKGDLDEIMDHLEWHREFLVYNIEEYIEGAFSTSLLAWFPGVVPLPIDGKLVGTILSPDSALKRVAAQNGFAYLAHSGAYEGYGDGTEPIKELALNHDCFRGFQIFNERKTHSSDNPVHPWGDNPHLGIWQEEHSDWDSELLAELPRWDNWLSQKLGPPLRKIFISGGSDAHGGFNYASFKTPIYGDGLIWDRVPIQQLQAV